MAHDEVEPAPAPAAPAAKSTREKEAWQNYGLSLLLLGIAPLLPILLELGITGYVNGGSVLITAAIYSIASALASNSRFYFGLFLFAAVVESAFYGATANTGDPKEILTTKFIGIRILLERGASRSDMQMTIIAVIITFVALAVERYGRHVNNREEFFEFLKRREA
jgi:hypothetical protein